MLAQDAIRLGFHVTVIDSTKDCPAAQVGAAQYEAAITDTEAISRVAAVSDVFTWEIEHIPAEHLVALENWGANIQPSPTSLLTIQDKLRQKTFLQKLGVPVAPFSAALDESNFLGGGPYVVKSRKGGYDGRGNLVVPHLDDPRVGETFGEKPVYAERVVGFEKELAVIAARDMAGNIATYPVVETDHEHNICRTAVAPADIAPRTAAQATELAHTVLQKLKGAGVFAIEMFAMGDDVLVNEIAPRVHNSGHWTDRGSVTSQFEQHIRAITGMPLGSTEMLAGAAAMVNILGSQERPLRRDGLDRALAIPGAYPHFYGKSERPARKIGHITILGETVEEVREKAKQARGALDI